MKMKKNVKILLGVYIGTFLFACLLANRMQKLEVNEDLRNKNESIVIRIQ